MREVFIASAKESLPIAKSIAEFLSSMEDIRGVLWVDIFDPGLLTMQAIELMLSRCCGAVFVASPDDESKIQDVSVRVPRTNVMLELGLVSSVLGRRNVAMCKFDDVVLPTDMTGFTYIAMGPYPAGDVSITDIEVLPGQVKAKLRKWASMLLGTIQSCGRSQVLHGYSGQWGYNLYSRNGAISMSSLRAAFRLMATWRFLSRCTV